MYIIGICLSRSGHPGLASSMALAVPCVCGSRPDSRCNPSGLWRKVRALQGRVPGNSWGARVHGQCHRKDTARHLPLSHQRQQTVS